MPASTSPPNSLESNSNEESDFFSDASFKTELFELVLRNALGMHDAIQPLSALSNDTYLAGTLLETNPSRESKLVRERLDKIRHELVASANLIRNAIDRKKVVSLGRTSLLSTEQYSHFCKQLAEKLSVSLSFFMAEANGPSLNLLIVTFTKLLLVRASSYLPDRPQVEIVYANARLILCISSSEMSSEFASRTESQVADSFVGLARFAVQLAGGKVEGSGENGLAGISFSIPLV